MASRFYFKYIPVRAGLTGVEFIESYLGTNFPTISWDAVISDGVAHYGILIGSGDMYSKSIQAIEGRFSAIRLEESVFIGACKLLYNPVADLHNPTPPTFVQFMSNHGITVTDELSSVKAFKSSIFKEIAKKKFADDNDSIADLAKCVTLLVLHYPNLTVEEKVAVDASMSILTSIYDKTLCINAFTSMVSDLQTLLSSYYTAKVALELATTIEAASIINYE